MAPAPRAEAATSNGPAVVGVPWPQAQFGGDRRQEWREVLLRRRRRRNLAAPGLDTQQPKDAFVITALVNRKEGVGSVGFVGAHDAGELEEDQVLGVEDGRDGLNAAGSFSCSQRRWKP